MKSRIYIFIFAMAAMLMMSCQKMEVFKKDKTIVEDPNTIGNQLVRNYAFKHFDTALLFTGLIDTLKSKNIYTVFAAEDRGFPVNIIGVFQSTSNYYYQIVQKPNSPLLNRTVSNTILPGRIALKTLPLAMNQIFKSLPNNQIFISKFLDGLDTIILFNGQIVKVQDIITNNGNLNVVDKLVFPPFETSIWSTLTGNSRLSWNAAGFQCNLFNVAIQRLGLDTLLMGNTPYTILVPQDDIFMSTRGLTIDDIYSMDINRLEAVIKFHIIPGIHFLNDFILNDFQTTNLISLPTLYSENISLQYNTRAFSSSRYLNVFGIGNKLTSSFQYYQAPYIDINRADIVCKNGIIHFLTSIDVAPN